VAIGAGIASAEGIMKTLSHLILGIALTAPLAIGSAAHADDRSTAAEHKENTTMDKLPKSVRATAQRESKGKNIESVTKSVDKNGVVIAYEVTYRDGTNETIVDIAKDGKVLMRHAGTPDSAPSTLESDQGKDTNTDTKNDTSKDTNSKDTKPNETKPDSSH
jgi:hypothetical protein